MGGMPQSRRTFHRNFAEPQIIMRIIILIPIPNQFMDGSAGWMLLPKALVAAFLVDFCPDHFLAESSAAVFGGRGFLFLLEEAADGKRDD